MMPYVSWAAGRRLMPVLALCAAVFLTGCGVNEIPRLDEEAKAAWSQVQNQYKRRADLIPNLVETVKAAAAHERETLQAVVEARAKATQMTIPADILTNPGAFELFQQNQGALSSALARLMAVVEAYPDLKANQNFATLQAQIEGTENRIAVARRDFIQAVKQYNTELRTFPGRIWKALLYGDAEPMQNFDLPPGQFESPPAVTFK